MTAKGYANQCRSGRASRVCRARLGDKPAFRRQHARRRGFIVLIVLIVIVMLTFAGLTFVLNLSTENKAAHIQGDNWQLDQVLASGEELIRAVGALSWNERQQAGGLVDNPDVFKSVALVIEDSDAPWGFLSVVSPRLEQQATAGIRYGLQDESAKLNLAVLPQWEREHPEAARAALLNLPGMTEPIADAILDWIDNDDQPREAGAESEYYASRRLPYEPRNGVPVSLEELLLVRGVSRNRLFGADVDGNFQVEPWESQLAAAAPLADGGGPPWAMLLTLYSAERNVDADQRPRIDLNQEDLEQLHQQLMDSFDQEWADFVVAYRQFGPGNEASPTAASRPRGSSRTARARGMPRRRAGRGRGRDDSETWERPPEGGTTNPAGRGRRRSDAGSDAEVELDFANPAVFEISSIWDLIGSQVVLPEEEPEDEENAEDQADIEDVERAEDTEDDQGSEPVDDSEMDAPERVLHSPLSEDPATWGDHLLALLDRTTVDSAQVIRGRINVYEAPREVLLAVPGLEVSLVDRILSVRGSFLGSNDLSRRHATWLLEADVLDMSQMRSVAPYLTGSGDVFRAQVIARLADSSLTARAEVIIDATVDPPRQVYWKDLRLLGQGFPDDVVVPASAGYGRTNADLQTEF